MHNVLLRSQNISWSSWIVDITALDSIRRWFILNRGRYHLIAIYNRAIWIAIVIVTWIYVIADVLRGYCSRIIAAGGLITVVIWRPIDFRLRLIRNTDMIVVCVVAWWLLKWMWRCCWSWFNYCRLKRRRRRRRINFVGRSWLLLLPSLINYTTTTTNDIVIIIILLHIIPSVIIVVVIVVGDLWDNATSRSLRNLLTRFCRINVRNIIIVVVVLVDIILIRKWCRNLKNIQLLLLLLNSRLILCSRRWSHPTNIITIIAIISCYIPSISTISIPTSTILTSILNNPFNPLRSCTNYSIRLLQFLLQYLLLLIFFIIMFNIINRLSFLVIRFG